MNVMGLQKFEVGMQAGGGRTSRSRGGNHFASCNYRVGILASTTPPNNDAETHQAGEKTPFRGSP
jgi:hypothetical protein